MKIGREINKSPLDYMARNRKVFFFVFSALAGPLFLATGWKETEMQLCTSQIPV
jgi:hypothetical protein